MQSHLDQLHASLLVHSLVRMALVGLEGFVALTALSGGLALLTGMIQMPIEWLQNTPFSSYLILGVVLTVVVGGSALLAAITVLVDRKVSVLASIAAGLILMGWISVQVGTLGLSSWLQPFYFMLGLLAIELAALLGMTRLPPAS